MKFASDAFSRSIHTQDERVLVADCVEHFVTACKEGLFPAVILQRPEQEKEEISAIVKKITEDNMRADIMEGRIIGREGAILNLDCLYPLRPYLTTMSGTFSDITGLGEFRIEQIVDMPRREDRDPEGTGHTHKYQVLNTVINGQRGTGWMTPDGEEVAVDSGDWLFMQEGFSHFATTDENDQGRLTFAFH